MTTTPANWYPDPSSPGQLRWWDGSQWTEHTHAGEAAQPAAEQAGAAQQPTATTAAAEPHIAQGQAPDLAQQQAQQQEQYAQHLAAQQQHLAAQQQAHAQQLAQQQAHTQQPAQSPTGTMPQYAPQPGAQHAGAMPDYAAPAVAAAPQQYVPGAATVAEPLKDVAGLGKVTQVALGVAGAFSLLVSVLLGLAGDVPSTGIGLLIGLSAVVLLLLTFATAIIYIVWFHRSYTNVEKMSGVPLRYGTGWSIGAWFIPIFNFVRPKQIADDIYRGSDPDVAYATDWKGNAVDQKLTVWWTLWIVSALTGRLGETSFALGVLSGVISAAAAVYGILVVRMLSERQAERAQRLGMPME